MTEKRTVGGPFDKVGDDLGGKCQPESSRGQGERSGVCAAAERGP